VWIGYIYLRINKFILQGRADPQFNSDSYICYYFIYRMYSNIVSTPGVVSGRPRIVNTRLSVEFILGLLAEGASVNIKDKDGRTPLTLAKKTSDVDGMDEVRRVCFKLIKDAGGRE